MTKSSMKCISFKLSRIRYVSQPEVQQRELLITGSWMEEVNRLCLWRYDCGELIDSGQFAPVSEQEDDVSPGVLGDSADEPRLVNSVVHPGWVEDMKTHPSSGLVFSTSSLGGLQLYRVHPDKMNITRVSAFCSPFEVPSLIHPANRPVALSSLSVAADGARIYVGDNLGRLAAIEVDRLPSFEVSENPLLPKSLKIDKNAILHTGADVGSVNALERVDTSTLVSVNQLGQLKVWDLRQGLNKPQQRLMRPSGLMPLYCLAHHPGQPHLLAVGGAAVAGVPAYIWDLRAEQYPLTEVACNGSGVQEVRFHPRQPRHLYMATDTGGLLCISCRGDSDCWTGFKGSHRKLVVSSVLPGGSAIRDVISFDMTHTQLVCGHSDAIIQTLQCDNPLY